jgi:predicted transcriptional regulator
MDIMDVTELRADLHNMIDKISDRKILKAVHTLLSENAATKSDWWDAISQEEREEIEKGISDVDRGEIKTHEEVMKKYKKWL